ncbi:hypothetical protein FRC07_004876 [Ceratobasidium sp. 392]|nr:hypothetical protein FRC07_004876 [Ceratobasidium sp. 392]
MSTAEEDAEEVERRRRLRQKNEELKAALRASQNQELRLNEQIQRLEQAQAGLGNQPNQQANRDPAPAAQEPTLSRADLQKATAASAGRRAAVVHMPFMDKDFLFDHRVKYALARVLSQVKIASLDPEDDEAEDLPELADEDNPKKFWDVYRFNIPDAVEMVREIIYHMPPGAGKRWFKPGFRDSFLEGYRKIRADVVFHIAKNHNALFGISDTGFLKKNYRVTMPEVKHIRETFQYKTLPSNKSDPKSLFRHKCIVGVVRYIFSGESAIATGVRSKKARNAHSTLWHATEVPPSVIAFAVTAIDFVLSGEGSFESSTSTSDYLYFFKGRLEMLERLYEQHLSVFQDLMDYFNRSVFPDLYPPEDEEIEVDEDTVAPPAPRGLTQADVAFLENL